MKIVAINGSPVGKASTTDIMLSAFLKGAKAAGAETVNIILAEKEIKHCKGCFSCWFNTPGKCVIQDDMAEALSFYQGADVLVLATPLYIDHVSGLLKNFMDRMIVGSNPYMEKDENGESRHVKNGHALPPKLMMMSNCRYAERTHFQVISHWIQRVALNFGTEVIAEIYASQGSFIKEDFGNFSPIIYKYLDAMEEAGKQIVMKLEIEEETKRILDSKFISDELYIKEINAHFHSLLQKA